MQESASFTARVVASHGRVFFVEDKKGAIFEATRKGKKTDAVVGDVIECSSPYANKTSILSIAERKNRLYRSDAWKEKTLASNLDAVAIVFASQPTFNPWFVWKAIVAARAENIRPVLIRTKSELEVNAKATDAFVEDLKKLGENVFSISARTAPSKARELLSSEFANQTVLLVGQSGMGKSTLLNTLSEKANARTQEISAALDNGKQTTTETRLYPIEIGESHFEIIDSPGFQEFGLAHLRPNEIIQAMPDIANAITDCRFYNCTHTREPGCSVLRAVENGTLSKARHDFYVWLYGQAKR